MKKDPCARSFPSAFGHSRLIVIAGYFALSA